MNTRLNHTLNPGSFLSGVVVGFGVLPGVIQDVVDSHTSHLVDETNWKSVTGRDDGEIVLRERPRVKHIDYDAELIAEAAPETFLEAVTSRNAGVVVGTVSCCECGAAVAIPVFEYRVGAVQ